MNVIPSLEWVKSTGLSPAIRGAAAVTDHWGPSLAGDRAVWRDAGDDGSVSLGWAMQRSAVSDIVDQFRLWKRAGFGLVVLNGCGRRD
jgi:hypothetical protein